MIPACLFAYPADDFHALAAAVPEFAAAIGTMSITELQELHVRTFDWSPDASLEIGWHLYGENYQRGEFLVAVRQMLRRYGIPESEGLPDHIAHIMPLLERLPADEAVEFSAKYLSPALGKIEAALAGTENPYLHLVRALARQYGSSSTPQPALVVLQGGADE